MNNSETMHKVALYADLVIQSEEALSTHNKHTHNLDTCNIHDSHVTMLSSVHDVVNLQTQQVSQQETIVNHLPKPSSANAWMRGHFSINIGSNCVTCSAAEQTHKTSTTHNNSNDTLTHTALYHSTVLYTVYCTHSTLLYTQCTVHTVYCTHSVLYTQCTVHTVLLWVAIPTFSPVGNFRVSF